MIVLDQIALVHEMYNRDRMAAFGFSLDRIASVPNVFQASDCM
jgi:hypothetical protein